MNVTRLERGWGAHFICADRCLFRRNTLLTCGDKRIIVSTVGAMIDWRSNERQKFENIGAYDRKYETMAFEAMFKDCYWDIDVTKPVEFDSPWSISEMVEGIDNLANDMHEAVVTELTEKLKSEVT